MNKIYSYCTLLLISFFFLQQNIYGGDAFKTNDNFINDNFLKTQSIELPNLEDDILYPSLNVYGGVDKGRAPFLELKPCKNKLAYTLSQINGMLISDNLNIELLAKLRAPGLSNSTTIFMDCRLNQENFTKVFIHELGHIHYHKIKNKINNPFLKKSDKYNYNNNDNFVSNYAMVNHYEDFAESFEMYISNNVKFRELTKNSSLLKKKYDFISENIFNLTML